MWRPAGDHLHHGQLSAAAAFAQGSQPEGLAVWPSPAAYNMLVSTSVYGVAVSACTILAAVDRIISVSLFSWLEPVPVLSLSSLRNVSLLNPSKLHTQMHIHTYMLVSQQTERLRLKLCGLTVQLLTSYTQSSPRATPWQLTPPLCGQPLVSPLSPLSPLQ